MQIKIWDSGYKISRFRGVTIDGVMDCWMALLTTCKQHSELHAIIAPSLISTLEAKSFPSLLYLQQPFPSNGF
jgi:hypothetical protein